jgi:predicted GTPase
MQNLSQSQMNKVREEVERRIQETANRPFVVSIMGQTGVGKSSLLNALFNTNLKTGAIRPTTLQPEKVSVKGKKGHEMIFWDLPGIGESEDADAAYLDQYRKYLMDSDVVLWAIHADNRSTSFDVQALRKLLGNLKEAEQSALMSRITFVLTKADLLTPPAWILGSWGDYGVFAPDKETEEVLRHKELYYQQIFIQPYSSLIVSQTYNDVRFVLDDPLFSYTKYTIYYRGMLSKENVAILMQRYPQYMKVFDRLYDNYRVIPCSALFKYNLHQLLLVILNKLGADAIERFKNFVDTRFLDQIPIARVRHLSNLVIFDLQHRNKIFDLSDGTFPCRNAEDNFSN